MLLFYNLKKTKMVHMYENVFGNWAVRSFKCVFFANYILLHLLLMDFHPAGSVVTGTRALLRHHILQFHSADAASYPSSRQRYFKMDQAQTWQNEGNWIDIPPSWSADLWKDCWCKYLWSQKRGLMRLGSVLATEQVVADWRWCLSWGMMMLDGKR